MMPKGSQPDEGPGFRPTGRQIVGGIIAVVLIVFIAANTTDVPINFIFFDVEMSMWLVLAGTALLGVLVGMGLGARRTKRKYLQQG